MPNLLQVSITLQAISPRFTINTRLIVPEVLIACSNLWMGSLLTGEIIFPV